MRCVFSFYTFVRETRDPRWTGAINQVKVEQQLLDVERLPARNLSCWIEIRMCLYFKIVYTDYTMYIHFFGWMHWSCANSRGSNRSRRVRCGKVFYETRRLFRCYPGTIILACTKTIRQQQLWGEESVCLVRVFWFVYSLESHRSSLMGLPSPEERPDINGPTVWPTNLTKRIISKKKKKERAVAGQQWNKIKNQNNSSRRN